MAHQPMLDAELDGLLCGASPHTVRLVSEVRWQREQYLKALGTFEDFLRWMALHGAGLKFHPPMMENEPPGVTLGLRHDTKQYQVRRILMLGIPGGVLGEIMRMWFECKEAIDNDGRGGTGERAPGGGNLIVPP